MGFSHPATKLKVAIRILNAAEGNIDTRASVVDLYSTGSPVSDINLNNALEVRLLLGSTIMPYSTSSLTGLPICSPGGSANELCTSLVN